MIRYNRMNGDPKSRRRGRRLSCPAAICTLACIAGLGCRQDSTGTTPTPAANQAAEKAETPPPTKAPNAAAANRAPGEDRPGRSAPATTKTTVTILSTEADLNGFAGSDSDSPYRITGGQINSTPGQPPEIAQPTGQKRQTTRSRALAETPFLDIKKEMLSKWEAIHSLSSSIESSYNQTSKEREIMTMGVGTRDALMADGKTRIRSYFETGIRVTIETEDPPIRETRRRTRKIFDGEFLYTQISTHEGTTATKTRATPQSFVAVGGPGLLAALRNLGKLQRLPNAQIGERIMYVFDGYNKPQSRVEYAVDQETGLLYSVTRTEAKKNLTQSLTFTKHDINMGFPEDHFVFTPNEGVEVQDLTQAAANAPTPAPRP